LLNLLGGLAGTASELLHLVGHHGEGAALFSGAGRLDGGIEREQIGLVGDALDPPTTCEICS
jgi:hypothetical protein